MSMKFRLAVAVALPLAFAANAFAQHVNVAIAGQATQHVTAGDFAQASIRVVGPNGYLFERSVNGANGFELGITGLADGEYRYSIQFAQSQRGSDGDARGPINADGRSANARPGPAAPETVDGRFVIRAGQVFLSARGAQAERSDAPKTAPTAHAVAKDQVIPDDLIVQGGACVGLDCVNNESFGFDTIRLKENNLRIKFDDTSATAGFTANDWQLTANDSASGGANKFSIEDITSARVPFTITASAADNAIFVDATGRVGFRTSTPVLDLHVSTSNTPALRMEQNSAGGFTAQTWDVGGNEANFFVRDLTGGSRLPFRVRPGAPTSSIDISADGDVGIGTASPTSKLDVRGDVSVNGSITQLSSRDAKTDFAAVTHADVLARVAALPISTWRYKDSVPTDRHLGPVAQDFYAAFGLGRDDEHVAPTDMAGVALAAIKALDAELKQRDAVIAALEARLDALEAMQN